MKSKYIMGDWVFCENATHQQKKVSGLASLLTVIAQYNKEVDALLVQHMKPYKAVPDNLTANYILAWDIAFGDKAASRSAGGMLIMEEARWRHAQDNRWWPLHGAEKRHLPCIKSNRYLDLDRGWFIDGMGNLVELWNGNGNFWKPRTYTHRSFGYRNFNKLSILLREGQF